MRAFFLGSVVFALTAPLASPVLASTLSSRELEAANVRSLQEAVRLVPGVIAASPAGVSSGSILVARGLGTVDPLIGTDPAMAVVVDDIVLPRMNGNNLGFFDVEQVAVHLGGQGLHVGRNSLGGAVELRNADTSDVLGGFVQFGYGRHDQWLARGSVDVPLADILQVKISAYYEDDHGFTRNSVTTERLNDRDRAGLRGAVRLLLAENADWRLSASYMENNGENFANFTCDPASPDNCKGRTLTTGMVRAQRFGGVSQYGVPVAGDKAGFTLSNRVNTTLLTSHLNWGGDKVQLKLITGYVDQQERSGLDYADGRALPDLSSGSPVVRGFVDGGRSRLTDGRYKQFSQDVRLLGTLGQFEYEAGLAYVNQDDRTDMADLATLENGTALGVPQLLVDRLLRTKTAAKSAYVQAGMASEDGVFYVNAGARYTDEVRRLHLTDQNSLCAGGFEHACFGAWSADRIHNKIWTPQITVGAMPGRHLHVFASAQRGYRTGGWNWGAHKAADLQSYAPETAWTYQAGVRTKWLEDKLSLNLTGFVIRSKDHQSWMLSDGDDLAQIIGNVGGLHNKGVEFAAAFLPVENLSFGFNLTWQDASYDLSDAGQAGRKSVLLQQQDCQAELGAGLLAFGPSGYRAGNCGVGLVTAQGLIADPIYTPRLTAAFQAAWDVPVPSAGVIVSPRMHILYRDKMDTDTANASFYAGQSQPAFDGTRFPVNMAGGDFINGSLSQSLWQVNAALEIRTDDEAWNLSLSCQNCLNKESNEASLYGYGYLNAPRSWMLAARRRF